jgi:transposase InsO family protein
MAPDPAEAVALHRFSVIAEATNPRLSPAERGHLVRDLASRAHLLPDGSVRTYSRGTLDRWVRAWRATGLAGLRPATRSDAGTVRRHQELVAQAAALRRESPARSSAQIAAILFARHGVAVSERTIRDWLAVRGLTRQALQSERASYGRFEASRPNEIWVGDVLVGPFVPHPRVAGSIRARLFLFLDDYSRLILHGVWVTHENARAGQHVLRAAIARRGIPEVIYLDNGAPFSAGVLARSCAVLGIRLVHSRPYRPQGRGKVERLFRFIRERFLVEIEATGVASLAELNDKFAAWAESVANTRVHTETRETPIARFLSKGPPAAADPALMAEAFRWSALRVVSKTATVSLAGNRYAVDPALVGRRVECRYDPEDLSRLDVFLEGRPAGAGVPFVIGRHVHPAVPQAEQAPPTPTGVDYLGMILAAEEAAARDGIAYRELADPGHNDANDEEDAS